MKLLLVFILLFLINSHVFSVQLNSSIMIFNESDLSQCEKSMEKAKNLNNKSVNIVLTLLVEINELKEVQKLYFKDKSAKPYPLGINFSNLLKDSLSSCIKKANELNIKPTLTVHIDDLKSKEWRHFINISPLKLYQGFSLEKDVYSPVIDALLLSKYPANLFLLGEMDLSYSLHSNEYNQIAKDYFDKLNIGVSFNYNKLFRAKPLKKVFFRMVGFSNYLPVPENCSAKSFQNHIRTIRIELKKVHLEK